MRAAGERGRAPAARREPSARAKPAPAAGRRRPAPRRRKRARRRTTAVRAPAHRPRRRSAAPRSISATLTVNSPLRAMNSRVPSSGSTRKNRSRDGDRRAGGGRLFGDDRDRRRPGRQTLADRRLGPLVGGGHRAAVALGARRRRRARIPPSPPGRRRARRAQAAAPPRRGRLLPDRVALSSPDRSSKLPFFASAIASVAARRRIKYDCARSPTRLVRAALGGFSHRKSPMTMVALAPMDLAALLCSRVCHDVISPVGAIVNGLEVLEDEKDPEMREVATRTDQEERRLRLGAAAVLPARLRRRRLVGGVDRHRRRRNGDARHHSPTNALRWRGTRRASSPPRTRSSCCSTSA